MPRISQVKEKKICEQALEALYDSYPSPLFTAEIARELARDEEFMKRLLHDLEGKKLVVRIRKNAQGKEYSERERWALSPAAKERYDELQ